MDVLVKIKEIRGIQINPNVFNVPEACFWLSWTWIIKKLLKAANTQDGGYEFTVGDVTYVAKHEKDIKCPSLYTNTIWRSVFELPFLNRF